MIRRILHPSDFSPASGAALKKAIEMAKSNRSGCWWSTSSASSFR